MVEVKIDISVSKVSRVQETWGRRRKRGGRCYTAYPASVSCSKGKINIQWGTYHVPWLISLNPDSSGIKRLSSLFYRWEDKSSKLSDLPKFPQSRASASHTSMANWFSIRMPRPLIEERIVSSTNGIGTTGYPPAEEWSWIPSHIIFKK